MVKKNKKIKIVGLIPSRLNSSRLFEKALLEIDGVPLVIHTFKRAKLSKYLDDIYVCTDSKKIATICKKYKCKVLFTGKNPTGTDRISEAADKLKTKYDLYIDIQGDEPLINPNHIDKVILWHQKIIYHLLHGYSSLFAWYCSSFYFCQRPYPTYPRF